MGAGWRSLNRAITEFISEPERLKWRQSKRPKESLMVATRREGPSLLEPGDLHIGRHAAGQSEAVDVCSALGTVVGRTVRSDYLEYLPWNGFGRGLAVSG